MSAEKEKILYLNTKLTKNYFDSKCPVVIKMLNRECSLPIEDHIIIKTQIFPIIFIISLDGIRVL